MARVGLVLGAGGAVGHGFHAGTLAALAEVAGWDARSADIVVGTSAGSVVGAMLRAGADPSDLFARAVGEPMSGAGRLSSTASRGRPWARPTRWGPAA